MDAVTRAHCCAGHNGRVNESQATGPMPGRRTRNVPTGNVLVWGLRACAALVVIACTAAWLAVDRAHQAAQAHVRATDAALAFTLDLAVATADLGAQLQASVDALVVGSGSAGEAVSHTVAISQNLRLLVAVVAGSRNLSAADTDQLTSVTNSLGDLEAALLETEGGLGETQQALTDVQPLVQTAAVTLQAVPDALRAQSADHRAAAADGRALWRLGIVLIGLSLLTLVAVLTAVVRRLDALRYQPRDQPA